MRPTLTRQNTAAAAAIAAAASILSASPTQAVEEQPSAVLTQPTLDEDTTLTVQTTADQQSNSATGADTTAQARSSQQRADLEPASSDAASAPITITTAPSPADHRAADPVATDAQDTDQAPVQDSVQPSPPATGQNAAAGGQPNPGTARPQQPQAAAAASGARTARQNASGVPFAVGVFGQDKARTGKFQQVVGRPVDIISVFPQRGSWDSIMDTWWLDTAPEGFEGTLDVGVPLWQEDGDLATAAAGGYNQQWETLGRTIQQRYPGSTVRIGWEFNLGGWDHHATPENVEQWKKAFRHASQSLKKGGPSLKVSWNPNKGKGDSLPDATQAWPGDDVVDLVGLDAYDWWPAYNEQTWPEHRDGDQGWKFWVDFARAHGKPFHVPETGVAPGNANGGGDNPFFIDATLNFLAEENAKDGIVESWVYFDETEPYIRNSIAAGQTPKSGQALKAQLDQLAGAANPAGTNQRPAPAQANAQRDTTAQEQPPQQAQTNQRDTTPGQQPPTGQAQPESQDPQPAPAPAPAPAPVPAPGVAPQQAAPAPQDPAPQAQQVAPPPAPEQPQPVPAPVPAPAPADQGQGIQERVAADVTGPQQPGGGWNQAEDGHGPVPS